MEHPRVPQTVRCEPGIFGGLLSRHQRYQAFSFFEAESEIKSNDEWKTGKAETPCGRALITKKKLPHTLCHEYCLTSSWLIWGNVCIFLKISYKNNVAAEMQLVSCAIPNLNRARKMFLALLDDAMACNSDIGASFMQTLYQYKSALPYMGCCTLPSSTTKGPKDTGSKMRKYCAPQPNRRPRRGFIVQLMTSELVLKMKSGRPIMFQI